MFGQEGAAAATAPQGPAGHHPGSYQQNLIQMTLEMKREMLVIAMVQVQEQAEARWRGQQHEHQRGEQGQGRDEAVTSKSTKDVEVFDGVHKNWRDWHFKLKMAVKKSSPLLHARGHGVGGVADVGGGHTLVGDHG